MSYGFVPALGTPIDACGRLVAESYERQINMMIDAGAVGLLCMGSMGQQAYLLDSECVKTAECAVRAAAKRVPVYVGAMDNSIERTKARFAALEHLDIDAYVLLVPYYSIDNDAQVMNYFRSVAASTKRGIILYDLAVVTKYKITYGMLCQLRRDIPNLVGIKTADVNMLRLVKNNPDFAGFKCFYSGLDSFDVVYPYGVGPMLDGMLSCTPKNTKALVEALDRGDKDSAAKILNAIIDLRNLFVANDLWPAYTAAMNELGCEGKHGPDWSDDPTDELCAKMRAALAEMGEL